MIQSNMAGTGTTKLTHGSATKQGRTASSAMDDWLRLFHAQSQEEMDMLAGKNEGMREAVEVAREMGLIRTLKWVYDDYWKAKRDRWAEDEYVRDEGIAIGRAEGKAEYILLLLQSKGEVPQELRDKITAEKDNEVLDRWHFSAIEAKDIGQFREKEQL